MFGLLETSKLCDHETGEVCETRADSTLFYRPALFGIRYNLFSQDISPPHSTVLYHESAYVLGICN